MKNKMYLYVSLIIGSILLFIIVMTILRNTKFIAPIIIVISIYNSKLKNTVICALDLLFWLP